MSYAVLPPIIFLILLFHPPHEPDRGPAVHAGYAFSLDQGKTGNWRHPLKYDDICGSPDSAKIFPVAVFHEKNQRLYFFFYS